MHAIWIGRRCSARARVLSFTLVFVLPAVLGTFVATARAQGPSGAGQGAASPAPPTGTPPVPVLTAPPPAAPTAPTKEQLAEAKKFFEAGLRLKKEGLYQEALASFIEANRISPRESIQNNLALTYRLLKDLASAYNAYEVLLARYGDKMKPTLKSEAQHALEELDVLTGVLTIGLKEPGVKLTVDGKELGQTPFTKPVRLNIGTHEASLSGDGVDTLTRSFEIRGHDSVPLDGPLVKTVLTGHVSVDVKQTNPPDPTVKILVDTADAGPPPYQADLEPGAHVLEARGEKTVAPPRQIVVEKKGSYTETLELHLQAGTMAVNVDVPDSEIAIDGAVVGRGVYEGTVPAGAHVLTVSKPGYAPYKQDVLIHDGEKVIENVPLRREGVGVVAPPHDWKGIYSQLDFVGLFSVTKPTNDVAQGIGYTPDTAINTSGVAGGGLGIRVGYSFGIVGIEGTALLGYDHSGASAVVAPNESTVTHPAVDPTQGRTESYDFHRIGGTVAVGARLMPKTQVIRPTLGVGAGVSLKTIFFTRSIDQGVSKETSDTAFYVAPSVMADAGIELGSTPGTRFYLGFQLLVDFASAKQVTTSGWNDPSYPPPTALNGVNGTDVFIGPVLGMQFGE